MKRPTDIPKEAAVHWVVRWTDTDADRDMAVVVEAPTRDAAQALAAARGLPLIFIARASQSDLSDARRAKLLPTSASAAVAPHTALGRPLGHAQLAALMFLGVATAMLHLAPLLRPMLA